MLHGLRPGYGARMAPDTVVADLRAALPADRILTDDDVVRPYLRDEAAWAE